MTCAPEAKYSTTSTPWSAGDASLPQLARLASSQAGSQSRTASGATAALASGETMTMKSASRAVDAAGTTRVAV